MLKLKHFTLAFTCCAAFFQQAVIAQDYLLSRTTRAVVVGVSEYEDTLLEASPEAGRDAELFAAFLRSRSGGLLSSYNVQLLTGVAATLAQFGSLLSWLEEESRPGDKVVLYFNGLARMVETGEQQTPYLFFADSPGTPAGAGAMPLSKVCYRIQEFCSKNSMSFSLYFDLGTSPGKDIFSDAWREWLKAFENSVPEAWTGFSGGKKTKRQKAATLTQVMLDGMLGLADADHNEKIDLKEAGAFLKEHTKAVPGGSALVMAFSNTGAAVSVAAPQYQLVQIQDDLFPSLVHIETTPMEDSLLGQADEQARQLYHDFIITIKLGQLIKPAGRCASDLYDSLTSRQSLAPLHSHLRRKLAAALQDDAQQALNAYLQTDTRELFRRWKYAGQYKDYPLYLEKAVALIGNQSFIYPMLKTKQHYFTGLTARLDAQKEGNEVLLKTAMENQRHALQFEPEAAFVMNEIGVLFSLMKNDSAEQYFLRAIEMAPRWSIPYSNLSQVYRNKNDKEKALQYAKISVELGPRNIIALNNLGTLYIRYDNLREAEVLIRQAIALDNSYEVAYYNLACVKARQGEAASAFYWLETALQKGFNDWTYLMEDTDLASLRTMPPFQELERKYWGKN